MRKCANFSPYMRRPLVIQDFAPDPSEFPYILGKFYFLVNSVTCGMFLRSMPMPIARANTSARTADYARRVRIPALLDRMPTSSHFKGTVPQIFFEKMQNNQLLHVSITCLAVKRNLADFVKQYLYLTIFRKQTLLKVVKMILTCILCDFRKVHTFLEGHDNKFFFESSCFPFFCVSTL